MTRIYRSAGSKSTPLFTLDGSLDPEVIKTYPHQVIEALTQ